MTSWLRSSLRKRDPPVLSVNGETNGKVIAETFERHWHQLRGIAAHNANVPSSDDVVAVINLLDQMIALLQMELATEAEDVLNLEEADSYQDDPLASLSDSNSPCLDILLSENVPAHILAASRMPLLPTQQDKLRAQQLKLFEALLGGSSSRAKHLLSHQPFLKPLIDLLSEFVKEIDNDTEGTDVHYKSSNDITSMETELHLVMVLNLLCSRLMEKDNAHLLRVFFNVGQDSEVGDVPNGCKMSSPRFLIFTILVEFLHRDGPVGHHARDALLLCMSLSNRHEDLGKHITQYTSFCPVLATGLSGLYSLLPRQFDTNSAFVDQSFHRITNTELIELPELSAFLSSLRFCDAVVQVAHSSVRQHLLGLIYMGFLVPVLGPALTQDSLEGISGVDETANESELICTTAYMELFLRQISEPALLAVFLRYIFTDIYEGRSIIEILVNRIGLQSQLCKVTLALFETLISLNCEDVMLWLVFRHLIPMTHLLPIQRMTIRQPDLMGRGAEKFISLTPICCTESRTFVPTEVKEKSNSVNLPTFLVGLSRPAIEDGLPIIEQPSSGDFGFNAYLADARVSVRTKYEATQCWIYDYDGLNPPPFKSRSVSECSVVASSRKPSLSCDTSLIESTSITTSDSTNNQKASTPNGTISVTEEELDRDFWNLMKDSALDSSVVAEARLLQSTLRKVRLQQSDSLSISSKSMASSQDDTSPRLAQEALDLMNSSGSLGLFLDLLLEKVELMVSNDLTTNLLVTSIISQLAAFPQPLLRSVLIHPDIVLQPSVRGLFSAIASLRQKLDNIMPTMSGAEEAVQLARKFMTDRLIQSQPTKRRDSNVSIMSAMSSFGSDPRSSRNSLTAAFSSMFKRRPATEIVPPHSSGTDSLAGSGQHKKSGQQQGRRLGREVRQLALAAVVLEEWLQELAAIAQEQSALQKEHAAFHFGLAASLDTAGLAGEAAGLSIIEGKHNSNILQANEDTSVKETRS